MLLVCLSLNVCLINFGIFDSRCHQDHLEIMDRLRQVLRKQHTANLHDRWVVRLRLCHLRIQDHQEGWHHLLILPPQVPRLTINSQVPLNEGLRRRKEATELLHHQHNQAVTEVLLQCRKEMQRLLHPLRQIMELPLQLRAVMELHHHRTDLCPHLQAEAMVFLRHQDGQQVACLLLPLWAVHAPLLHLHSTDKI